ncbi:MAG TPA: hypothetical protein VF168_00490 [Trueperaceae bacterium]
MNNRHESMGRDALEHLVEKWKPVLGLSEWAIRVELVDFSREWQSGDVKVDEVEKSALVLMSRRPFRDEEQVLLHELVHVVLWPLDRAAMDLVETAPQNSRERELGEAMIFRALEPVTEQLTAALLRASGVGVRPAWAALEEEAKPRLAHLPGTAEWGLDQAEVLEVREELVVSSRQGVGIEQVWERIERSAGEPFRQLRGGKFTYEVRGNALLPDRTNRQLARSQFERALELVPLENTAAVQHLQGPSYIYAILMDPRVRKDDW